MFKGVLTAVVTPFRDGRVDEGALAAIVDWQISEGIDGIVACGSTGEGATLTNDERFRIVKTCVAAAAGRVPIVAGAGSNSTDTAIATARLVGEAGADAALQVVPYYNKPMPEGMYLLFSALATAAGIPIILYNVPSRTGVNMPADTTLRLANDERIIGIKESCGRLEQIKEIIDGARKDFAVYCGDDALNLDVYNMGGAGAISVTANVAPAKVAAVWDAHSRGDKEKAKGLQLELADLNRAMFIETNPIPAKTSLAMMGKCREEFRLPITPIGAENRIKLKEVLTSYGLI